MGTIIHFRQISVKVLYPEWCCQLADEYILIETLLHKHDELYQELPRLRQADKGAFGMTDKGIAHYNRSCRKERLFNQEINRPVDIVQTEVSEIIK